MKTKVKTMNKVIKIKEEKLCKGTYQSNNGKHCVIGFLREQTKGSPFVRTQVEDRYPNLNTLTDSEFNFLKEIYPSLTRNNKGKWNQNFWSLVVGTNDSKKVTSRMKESILRKLFAAVNLKLVFSRKKRG